MLLVSRVIGYGTSLLYRQNSRPPLSIRSLEDQRLVRYRNRGKGEGRMMHSRLHEARGVSLTGGNDFRLVEVLPRRMSG